ncbi:MAG TPA: hypothetical protein IGS37_08010 [Synechococcales cyanobacterium M55_K2018_004]|nr:hypothetical protein [Synechococcales cyanobacterium M55_K2018_004]
MRIVWEQSIYFGNAPVFCSICGHRTYPIRSGTNQLLLAVIYDRQGKMRGEACMDCVASGAEVIKARLEERIESIQEKLDELKALAHETMELPSLEDEFEMHRREVG